MRLARRHFEKISFEIAAEILAGLPPGLRAEAETVLLEVRPRPDPGQLDGMDTLLGLYEGVPLVERGADQVLLSPDRITLFQEALQAMARDEAELRRHIRETLIHELGHFFGFDEDELERRGWA